MLNSAAAKVRPPAYRQIDCGAALLGLLQGLRQLVNWQPVVQPVAVPVHRRDPRWDRQ